MPEHGSEYLQSSADEFGSASKFCWDIWERDDLSIWWTSYVLNMTLIIAKYEEQLHPTLVHISVYATLHTDLDGKKNIIMFLIF